MLQLSLGKKKDADWLDLGHGVRLLVKPLNTPLMMAARHSAAMAEAVDGAGEDDEDGQLSVTVAKVLGGMVIKDWEGVGDEEGEPISVSQEAVDALFDIWPLFEAFQTKYIAGAMLIEAEAEEEKNV